MITLIILLASALLQPLAAHSWMSCPISYNRFASRGGSLSGPCEVPRNPITKTTVSPGQRLKVQWTSNNHGGGFVKISLIPAAVLLASASSPDILNNNYILKIACYGHDERPGRYQFGDCIHPCNARPGCEWQKSSSDIERFDTSVAIPANLPDGDYVLQWVGLVGNAQSPYFSCASLTLKGGNENIKCKSPLPFSIPKCLKSGGPSLDAIVDTRSAKMGPFCFNEAGEPDVDFNIATVVPINRNCEGRVSCSLSVNPSSCQQDFSDQTLVDPDMPFRSSCPAVPVPIPTTSTTVSSRSSSSTTSTKATTSSTSTTIKSTFTTVKSTSATTKSTSKATSTTTKSTSATKPTPSSKSTTTKSSTTATRTTTSDGNPKPTGVIVIGDACFISPDDFVCFGPNLARCVFGKWIEIKCAPGTRCVTGSNGRGYCDHST